jgi:uncharacterized metal-binding protein YceD (DUF177 family)
MIATLEKLSSGNAIIEEEQSEDPRWAALKKLK